MELTIRTCFKNLSMKSWMPFLASGLREYWHLHGNLI